MSARTPLTRLVLSLLMLAVLTAFAALHSGKSPASSAPHDLDAQDRSTDPSADLNLASND